MLGGGVESTIARNFSRRCFKSSRAFVSIEILPKTFTAKLFVQSLKLAKSRVDKKLAQRTLALAAEIEQRYRRSQAV